MAGRTGSLGSRGTRTAASGIRGAGKGRARSHRRLATICRRFIVGIGGRLEGVRTAPTSRIPLANGAAAAARALVSIFVLALAFRVAGAAKVTTICAGSLGLGLSTVASVGF